VRSVTSLDGPFSLLALGAHPDDVEIGCGGTLIRFAREERLRAAHVVVFSGDGPRADEARRAARAFLEGVGDLRIEVGDARDGYFPAERAAIKDRFEALKADADPDLVLTPRADDAHQDHRLVAELTWNTFRDAVIVEYEIPKWDGDLVTPNLYVPLSPDVVDRKSELLVAAFGSQADRDWFTPETFRSLARLRGIECRAPEGYAEGFHARKLVW